MQRGENEPAPQASQALWVKVAGITFSLWSMATPIGVTIVRDGMNDLSQRLHQQEIETARLQERLKEAERRIDDEVRWRDPPRGTRQ